jgi:anti-sigma regulatory factor (Ser/Thr protein kinase)
MVHRWSFERRDYAGAHEAHQELRALLRERGVPEDDVATCELVFGELVTNALKYGEEPVAAGATLTDSVVELEIEDSGQCFNLRQNHEVPADAIGGRGLLISSVLAWSLNVNKESDRCRVTATIPVKAHFDSGKSDRTANDTNGNGATEFQH